MRRILVWSVRESTSPKLWFHNVVIVLCGFWYNPQSQAIICRMIKLRQWLKPNFRCFLLAFPTKYIVCHYIIPLISVSVSATPAKRLRTLRLRFLNETEIYLELKWFNVTLSNHEAMNIRRAYFVFSFRCHHAPHKSNGWHNLTMKCECVLFMRAKDMPTAVTIINNASSFVHSSGLLNGTFHNDLINSLSSRDI